MAFNLLGGDPSLQTQDSLSNALNFNPQHILGSGSGNYLSSTPTFAYTSEQTAKQETGATMDVGASVGVGVGGGSGSGGQVDKATVTTDTMTTTKSTLSSYLPYIIIGGAVIIIAGIFLLKRKK